MSLVCVTASAQDVVISYLASCRYICEPTKPGMEAAGSSKESEDEVSSPRPCPVHINEFCRHEICQGCKKVVDCGPEHKPSDEDVADCAGCDATLCVVCLDHDGPSCVLCKPRAVNQSKEAKAKGFFEALLEGNECTDVFNALRKPKTLDDIKVDSPDNLFAAVRKHQYDDITFVPTGDSQEPTGSPEPDLVYLWYMVKDGFNHDDLWRALRATKTVAFHETHNKTFIGFTWHGPVAYKVPAFQELAEAYLAQ